MERLTGRRDGRTYIVGCPDFALPKIAGLIIQQTVDRLAAYEDTGLEPEEARSQKELFDYLVFDSTPSEDIERFKRLRELAEADREGRCVVLPCRIGDTLYRIQRFKRGKNWRKEAEFIRTVELNRNNLWRIVMDGEIGKTVFLTREEAEAALATDC